MHNRRGPFILLAALILILIFVGGIKYGQQVEKTNKTIAYIMSITPSPSPAASPVPTLTFANLSLKTCGVTFMYPSTYKIKSQASDSAVLTEEAQTKLSVSCMTPAKNITPTPTVVATSSATRLTIKNQSVTTTQDKSMTSFVIVNPYNGKRIEVAADKNILQLFTLSFDYLIK